MILRTDRTLLFCIIWAGLANLCFGQPAGPKNRTTIKPSLEDNQSCESCHIAQPKKSKFLGYTDDSSNLYLAATNRWRDEDKHRDAFRLLHQAQDRTDTAGHKEKKRLVTNILGFPLAEAFDDGESYTQLSKKMELQPKVAKVKLCLNCHATWPQPETGMKLKVPLEYGVSCQTCHGEGFIWKEIHESQWWRLVKPDVKEHLGFTEIRDPAKRTALCTSCHIGDYSKQRFVPHEWYAAGHPPLPSFEFSAFAAQMPVHWLPLSKKDFEGKEEKDGLDTGADDRAKLQTKNVFIDDHELAKSYLQANFPNLKPNQDPLKDHTRWKDSVISSAVVLEQYAKLAKDYATAWKDKQPADRPVWPEFSLYDCASCHHELRSGHGFPQRPFGNSPAGRPPAHFWPLALAELGELHLAGYNRAAADDSLRTLGDAVANFERALTGVSVDGVRGPVFGYPGVIAESAGAMESRMTSLIEKLREARFDEANTGVAIAYLTNTANVNIHDYHSARQRAWAVREIAKDNKNVRFWPANEPTPTESLIDQLFGGAQPGIIRLKLPATQADSIIQKLPENLKAISEFDAQLYDAQLKAIPGKLGIEQKP